MSNILFLLRGLPGCGKTTLAEQLASTYNTTNIFAADDYFYKWDPISEEIQYRFDPKKLGRAHELCRRRVDSAMFHGGIVIVHNTFTTEKELRPYFDLVERYHRLGDDWLVQSLIVENRHGGTNTHNVPNEALMKMRNRFSIKL